MSTHLSEQQLLSLARKGSYRNYFDTRTLYDQNKCPFCIDNGFDPERNVELWRTEHWIVWEAPSEQRPESHQNGLDRHFMIVPLRHFQHLSEMTQAEHNDLWYMQQRVIVRYGLTGFMDLSRSGDLRLTGATELHYSRQFKVPSRSDPGRKRLAEPLIKTVDEEAENEARGMRFGALYVQGVTPDQFDQLVKDGKYDKKGNKLEG